MFNIASVLRSFVTIFAAIAVPVSFAQNDPANVAANLNVGFNSSAEVTLEMNALRLLEPGQRIRLMYGAVSLGQVLKLKSVVAPPGITVTLKSLGFASSDDGDTIRVKLNIANAQYNSGNHPVQVVLVNAQTSATTTLHLIVHVQ